jgi:phthalate 4,5-dioxygenase
MGEIVDHTFEHLAPSDQMITRTRRRLLIAARSLRDQGTAPPCVDQPDIFRQVRSGEAVLPARDWQDAYRDRLQHVVRSAGWREAAE